MNPTISRYADRNLALGDVVPLFLDHLRLLGRAPATLKSHQHSLRTFGKYWEARDLREASAGDLESYAQRITRYRSRETAYLYLSAVRALFRFLVERNFLLLNPASELPMPRMAERVTGRILAREDMKALVESPDLSGPCGVRDRALLECLYSTGLRIAEARELKVEDIGEAILTVRCGKGGKGRTLPLGREAQTWIGRYLRDVRPAFLAYQPQAEHLWLTRWGRLFSGTLFHKHIHLLGAMAGIEGLTCHMIRRSMATHLLAAGASPLEVSQLLGHEDLQSLGRYVKVAARELRETHASTHPREQDS